MHENCNPLCLRNIIKRKFNIRFASDVVLFVHSKSTHEPDRLGKNNDKKKKKKKETLLLWNKLTRKCRKTKPSANDFI